ncbi:DUF3072 domain-containing protein [Palleronia sp. LCG004]|uniref:DUF3072 domain-containing protein n=1 Tax=Palleronia sp. LCG004 TaxID=3079304 RepID=UPI0029431BF3|nr:DUF3072 domain-containing protein [Palleronia sp. LCG004]WOI56597.1 DUF3072 domain-containing protein [Palleronia sp. LCG004]
MADRDDKGTKHDPMDVASFPVAGAVETGENPHGNEPMTDKQAAELRELCEKHDEPMDGNLTQDQADARIEALKSM